MLHSWRESHNFLFVFIYLSFSLWSIWFYYSSVRMPGSFNMTVLYVLFHMHVNICLCVCVQRAAPTKKASAMRAASVGATQPSTDKLKVQMCLRIISVFLGFFVKSPLDIMQFNRLMFYCCAHQTLTQGHCYTSNIKNKAFPLTHIQNQNKNISFNIMYTSTYF